ncbi:MAG: nucleoside phosphorylase [Bacteroidales bacterium]|nr:nucleoside phosphorylase [Bacteroidales bacterium]
MTTKINAPLKPSELVTAPDGSLYHIRLTADTLADRVILVGDPQRVDMFKDIFETIEHESINRELHALTGIYHGARITALSTGMGCDNIDIVLTELDAAANIVGNTDGNRHLRIVRVGTSGSLQADIDCRSTVASRYALGMDGLMNYYAEWDAPLASLEQQFAAHMQLRSTLSHTYAAAASSTLLETVGEGMHHGITVTAGGFYGPQGRTIRLHPSIENLNEKLASFAYDGTPVTNLEMETSAIYGFSHLLGHEALTVCLIIANRPQGTFLNDYHAPMRRLVGTVVERLAI